MVEDQAIQLINIYKRLFLSNFKPAIFHTENTIFVTRPKLILKFYYSEILLFPNLFIGSFSFLFFCVWKEYKQIDSNHKSELVVTIK